MGMRTHSSAAASACVLSPAPSAPGISAQRLKRQRPQRAPPSQGLASGSRDEVPVALRSVPTPWHPATEPAQEPVWRTTATTATFRKTVQENEEVVPVNAVSTRVLPSGVTVGR